jgi:hypothetical protein
MRIGEPLSPEVLEFSKKSRAVGASYDDAPYVAAIQQAQKTGGLDLYLDPNDPEDAPRKVKMRMQKAASKVGAKSLKWVFTDPQGNKLPDTTLRFVFREARVPREGGARRGRPPKNANANNGNGATSDNEEVVLTEVS